MEVTPKGLSWWRIKLPYFLKYLGRIRHVSCKSKGLMDKNILQFTGAIVVICGVIAIIFGGEMNRNDMVDIEREKVIKILKNNGYTKDQNISDFWFTNREKLNKKVNKINPTLSDKFDLIIRWESELGKECRKQIKGFIDTKINKNIKAKNEFLKENPLPNINKSNYNWNILLSKAIIDFNEFSFVYKERGYTLVDFAGCFKTSQVGNINDLRGINLTGINISDAVVRNANFAWANLNRSRFFQVDFVNTNLVHSSLIKSNILNISLDANSSISNADLRGAFVNIIRGLNDTTMHIPFQYNEVSYFWLIKKLISNLLGLKDDDTLSACHNHTIFLAINTKDIYASESKQLKEYINWYQHISDRLDKIKLSSCKEKFGVIFPLLITKYWSSYLVLACWVLIFISFFAIIYCLFPAHFTIDKKYDFITSFYNSFLAFTSLGPGASLNPISIFARIVVLVESVIGYISLGVLIFLIGHKVSKLF